MEHIIWSMGILLLLIDEMETKIGRKMEGKKKRERRKRQARVENIRDGAK
jgi:hypothetical protein